MALGPEWGDSRVARWRVQLLTQREATINSDLEGVSGGMIDWDIRGELRAGGNLDLKITTYTQSIDWARCRIRIEYVLTYQGRTIVTPCGIYIPSAPKRDMSSAGSSIDLEFFDKSIILKQDCLRSTKSFAKGSKITDALRWVITSTGETNVAITRSSMKFKRNRSYPAGTSKLEIVKKLLKDLNYFPLYNDNRGQFRCHPYVTPSRRGVAYQFRAGAASIHSAAWALDQDGFDVPNRVVCIGRKPTKGKPITSVAEDTTSRWGKNARGRWITKVVKDREESSQKKMDATAKLLLRKAQAIHDRITIKHGFLPVLMNDIAEFSSQGYSGAFAWRTMRANLTPTGLAESTLEGVAI